jgi:hypothetical protein
MVRASRHARFRCRVLGAALQLKVRANPSGADALESEGGDAAAFALDLRLRRHQRGANVRELECRRSSGSDAS